MYFFRENLIRFRKAKYPSARKFAEALGIPYNTYLSYENPAKPTEPRYELLIKIATLLDVTIDELLGFVNVDADAKRLVAYINSSPAFKVNVYFDENGNERYEIVLKNLSRKLDDKSFSKEEFVKVVRELVSKAIEFTVVEQQVLKSNIDFMFCHLLENYLKVDLLYDRPHDFNFKLEDYPKLFNVLGKIYSESDKTEE